MNPFEVVVQALCADGEKITMGEMDKRLTALLHTLAIPQRQAEACIRFWLKITDHENPSRLPDITEEEAASFNALARQLQVHRRQ